jgi:hypothetical protein
VFSFLFRRCAENAYAYRADMCSCLSAASEWAVFRLDMYVLLLELSGARCCYVVQLVTVWRTFGVSAPISGTAYTSKCNVIVLLLLSATYQDRTPL